MLVPFHSLLALGILIKFGALCVPRERRRARRSKRRKTGRCEARGSARLETKFAAALTTASACVRAGAIRISGTYPMWSRTRSRERERESSHTHSRRGLRGLSRTLSRSSKATKPVYICVKTQRDSHPQSPSCRAPDWSGRDVEGVGRDGHVALAGRVAAASRFGDAVGRRHPLQAVPYRAAAAPRGTRDEVFACKARAVVRERGVVATRDRHVVRHAVSTRARHVDALRPVREGQGALPGDPHRHAHSLLERGHVFDRRVGPAPLEPPPPLVVQRRAESCAQTHSRDSTYASGHRVLRSRAPRDASEGGKETRTRLTRAPFFHRVLSGESQGPEVRRGAWRVPKRTTALVAMAASSS